MTNDRSIFYSSSFFSLSEEQKNTVRAYALVQNAKDLPLLDTVDIFRHQSLLATPLDYYSKKIKRINLVQFKYMTLAERQMLEDELMYAFYLFSARYQLDYAEKRGRALADRAEQIKDCAYLLNELRQTPLIGKKETIALQLNHVISHGETPVKYLTMQTITPLVLEVMKEIRDGHVQSFLDIASAFNERRLYWVWAGGGGLLGTFIKLLADDFYYKTQALDILEIPNPITGGLSWLLYYIRFGVRAALFAYHARPAWFMNEDDEERKIPWDERFAMQWRQRKFYLLNDFFWASANLACFFWLVGSGMPGYYGGVLTGVLLCMDISIAIWAFEEEKTQYIQDMTRYQEDIQALRDIKATKRDIERPLLDRQLQELVRAQRQCKLDWDYKLNALFTDLMYAASLFCAFALVCSFFFPPAALVPATALVCGIAGTVLCFACNAFFSAVKEGLKVCKSIEEKQYNKQDKQQILQHYLTLNNEFAKRQCYLDYLLLAEETTYNEQVIVYQKMQLLRSTLIDLLVPPVIFVGIVFFPLGIGIPILAAGLALAVTSSFYIDANYKPKGVTLPSFDEQAFRDFNPIVELSKMKQTDSSHGLFGTFAQPLSTEEGAPLLGHPPL